MFDVLRIIALLAGSALPVLVPNVPHYCDPSIFSGAAPAPFGAATKALHCEPYVIETPKAMLNLAVARTEPERERGLMYVTLLEPRAGMLFAFADDAEREFWMKNTLIPLDMVFVDARGIVTSIAARVPASTVKTAESDVARRHGHGRYVIELRAGDAEASGLVTGMRLVLAPVEAVP
jgi:uncharacterized membrane protein (UPF0127 family)